MILPAKGNKVELETIYTILRTYGHWDLLRKLVGSVPDEPFVCDG